MKSEISKGLIKCKVCGEYNGEIMKKYLNWGNDFFNNSWKVPQILDTFSICS